MRPTELLRAATAVASRAGWEVHGPPPGGAGDASGEVRLVVSGGGLPGRCLLRVRARGAPPGGPVDVVARRAAASEHVVGVVEEPPASRVRGLELDAVVLGYAHGGTLETLLASRRGLRGGEAAMILLGVAAGIGALHGGSWSAPDLTPAGVVFVGDGCPALDALDRVAEWTPSASVADAEAFYRLARLLCLRVTDGTGMLLLASVETGLRQGKWSAVEASILNRVAPEGVRLSGEPEWTDAARPGRAVGDASAGARGSGTRRGRSPVSRFGTTLGAALGSAMDALDGTPGRSLMRWLCGRLKRRPALVVIGILPLAAALALIILLPGSPAESASAAGEGRPTTAGEERTATAPPLHTVVPTPLSPAGADVAKPSGRATTTPASAASAAPGPEGAAMVADDPVDAARAVLDARLACFRARPPVAACLEDVLDGSSALLGEETATLGIAGAAASRDYTDARFSLVEIWGGAALVSVVPDTARTPKSKPASLLLVRSEAGWRLRAVFP